MFRRNTAPHEPANKEKSTGQTPVNISSTQENMPNKDTPDKGINKPLTQSTEEQGRVPSSPQAMSENDLLTKGIKEGSMSGFVGGGTMLTGEVTFEAMLRIDGHFSGRISSEKGTLIVSAGGRVDGDIMVGVAKINGTVKGDIFATERVELGRSAHLTGNIQTPALVVEQGALFDGGCRMDKPSTLPAEKRAENRAQSTESPVSKETASVTKAAVEEYRVAKASNVVN
jgi:cytoskeletal protein CcmA (bactofilin family)